MFRTISIAFLTGIICVLLMLPTIALASNKPEITEFNPKKGASGDNIVIHGNNLVFASLSSNKVKFGSKPADVTMMSKENGKLVVTVPRGAIPAPISLANINGETTTQDSFEVIPGQGEIASSGTKIGASDRVILDTYLSGFKNPKDAGVTYYAPPEAILWVVNIDDAKNVRVRFKENWTDKRIGTGKKSASLENIGEKLVEPDTQYTIELGQLQDAAISIQGVDYGVLVAPYKYHPQDRALTGEATLGGYAGYRWSWPGVSITFPVLSAGVGVVNVLKDSATTETKSAPSFSIASGAIISLTKTGLFQIGILCGADWAGKGNHYRYEGQPWIAVSFGTNIAN